MSADIMIFATPSGEGVRVDGAAKRGRPRLDSNVISYARGETFERYRELGLSDETIGSIFGITARTVRNDLKRLADEKARRAARGLCPLPVFGT